MKGFGKTVCYDPLCDIHGGRAMNTIERDEWDRENKKLKSHAERLAAVLEKMLPDFESGYIANPSATADRKRLRHEAAIREALAQWEPAQ
jgi:hypothetical protein